VQRQQRWEGMGSASGILAALSFVFAFIVFMTTDPSGTPPYPSVENAQQAPAFMAAHLNAYRIELLLLSLGLALFLWFVGSLRTTLGAAEGGPARGSTLAVVGASVGAGMLLVACVLGFTAGLSTSPAQADTVPTLYVASALLVAIGGGVLSLFLFAVAKVILQTAAMAKWLGWLAFIGAFLCLFGFLTPFFDAGALNAATGVLGLWLWWAWFVVWLLVASVLLVAAEREMVKTAADAPLAPPMTGTERAL
jgi:magnesium-transporting ATPase (P-type)